MTTTPTSEPSPAPVDVEVDIQDIRNRVASAREFIRTHYVDRGVSIDYALYGAEEVIDLCARQSEELAEARAARDADAKLLTPNPCSVCGGPITGWDGTFIGTGDGSMRDGGSFAHYGCYWRDEASRRGVRVISAQAELSTLRASVETKDAEIERLRAEIIKAGYCGHCGIADGRKEPESNQEGNGDGDI